MGGEWLVPLAIAAVLLKQALTLTALLMLTCSLDDLLIDLAYFTRRLVRRLTVYRRQPRSFARGLPGRDDPQAGWFAILVPAWDEAAVIGRMLAATLERLDYARYRLFVGSYPNDAATGAAISALDDPRLIHVVTSRPGPTSKADCLNQLYAAALDHGQQHGICFKGFVLHDAEDLVDPAELQVFNHLLPAKGLVQLPVVPLELASSPLIAGSYLDEFAENHGKDLVVREWCGAGLPSAGVGCAFSASALAGVARQSASGQPFNAASITEDYELGVRLGLEGHRQALVRMPPDAASTAFVATREYFPDTLEDAVRQKTRWLLGITLLGWHTLGWQGGLANRYWLLRDRKSLLTAFVAVAGYAVAAALAIYWGVLAVLPDKPAFPPMVVPGSLLAWLLYGNGVMLVWRLVMRALFTTRVYGWRQGLLAILRAPLSNVINAMAATRAIGRFRLLRSSGGHAHWDKTRHRFPEQA